jgi:hypothetical protein
MLFSTDAIFIKGLSLDGAGIPHVIIRHYGPG